MSNKRIRISAATATVSFIEISPSKRQRRRICSFQENTTISHPVLQPNNSDDDLIDQNVDSDCSGTQDESRSQQSYLQHQQRASKAWMQIRDQLRVAYMEGSVPNIECICHVCELPANIMCQQCGPQVFYCAGCAESQHTLRNIFHRPQLWQVCECMNVCRHSECTHAKFLFREIC